MASLDEASAEEPQHHRLLLIDSKKKTVAELRCASLQPLKDIQNQIADTLQRLDNLGLPLTVDPHDGENISFLNSGNKIELRGLVNLQMLMLLSYHFRDVAITLYENDLVMKEKVTCNSAADSDISLLTMQFFLSVDIELFPTGILAPGQGLHLLVHLCGLARFLRPYGLRHRETCWERTPILHCKSSP